MTFDHAHDVFLAHHEELVAFHSDRLAGVLAEQHPVADFDVEVDDLAVAVGKGKRDDSGKVIALDVKPGDKVLFGKYSGQTVKVKGDELLVMREEDIMGVIEGH